MSSEEISEPKYSSINSRNTNEHNDALDELLDDDDAITDDDEDNLICEITLNADNYRLCRTKAAQDAALGEIDASLAKKTPTTTEAPHLDTKALITKLDDVSKTVDLDVSTNLAEQIKDPDLCVVRSWLREKISADANSILPKIQ